MIRLSLSQLRRASFPAIVILALSPIMQSCFTGIESTPKITAADLRRERVTVTDEQRLVADILSAPFDDWAPGKKFITTDSRIGLIFGATASSIDIPPSTVLTYRSFDTAISPTGQPVTNLHFDTPDGSHITYRVNTSIDELRKRSYVEVPYTIQQSLVDDMKSILKDRRLYITTRLWYDADRRQVTSRKFIPVTITDVSPGNATYPLFVSFTDPEGRSFGVFMSAGTTSRGLRNFSEQFSLTDPRRRHATVTDEHWQLIVQGLVTPGMTRDEVRLSLGSPIDIDRGHDWSSTYERWIYDGGTFLIFEDGVLVTARR